VDTGAFISGMLGDISNKTLTIQENSY